MGKIARKKKGRPSKADLARCDGLRRNPLSEQPSETDLRRSLRRRNLTYHGDFDDEDEEDDDEDERREKKLKLVLKLPHKAGFGGVDSSESLSRADAKNVAHASAPESRAEAAAAALSASSSEYGDGNKPFKKRRIDGDNGPYDGGDGDDDEDDDDARSIGSSDQKKGRGRNAVSKGTGSVPGTPSTSPLDTPLPDKKLLELILDKLQKKDTYGVYAEPVDPEELPDYHDVIEHPMDFGTIRKKLASGAYSNFEQFESDVFLVCTNAMQYNAPETIYFKQARSIQELARKKFQKLVIDIECNNTELKSEQKIKSNSTVKKPIKKSLCRNAQEPVGSDFSSGATLATTGDAYTWSNVMQADRPNNVDGAGDGNSSLTDNKPEKAEEQVSGKGFPSKFGRKPFVLDENRRATYNTSIQPVDMTDSIFATFDGENKQLVAVGFHADHSYARSLARFAATLGTVAWKVASQKIEKALPVGSKFGRGWVGEYEPLPTPVLMFEKNNMKQLACSTNLNCKPELRKDIRVTEGLKVAQDEAKLGFKSSNSSGIAASSKIADSAIVHSRPNLNGKFFGGVGTKSIINSVSQQQNPLTANFVKSDNNVLPQVELNCSTSVNGSPIEVASRTQFEYGSEMTSSRLLEMLSRNRNLIQSVAFKKTESDGAAAGSLPNGKVVTSSSDINKVISSSSNYVSSQMARAATYFPRGNQEQGLSDPVQLMRMLSEKTQSQQKSSICPVVDGPPAMSSVSSSRRDDSSTAATSAARSWMSVGSADFKPTDSLGSPKMQIAAASLYNPARELPQPVSRFCEEPPVSGGLQMQSEKSRFPSQSFLPQSIRMANEEQYQNNRQILPQLVTTDLARFQAQSPWRGLVPHGQPKQKQEMLPPDLNISFQSSGSPVRQSSGIMVDSQQPDLALQL
ncbi:PREDICTED: uncharacterized protein LOC104612779 [Nelumbo nucifera]|uniref:Uncharacterized protein LOC104612779 n=1 Tax=Nelumbo nucifera TaxID=4432 RepID=A0A1U8BF67_NELNU|nr:PREDICTED: uncharacterized protein LOC104612779 [Nelumbo nucifera]